MKNTTISLITILAVAGATALQTAGCAGTPTRQSAGEYIDDAAITTKVKAEFVRDPVVQAFDVGVDTFKGTVQLNGFVETPEQKARAEQIARTVPGVVTVQNKLSVKTQAVK